jgi:hypothetical protein
MGSLGRMREWLRSKGEGHLTRINDILMNLMEAERRVSEGKWGFPGLSAVAERPGHPARF